MAGHVGLVSVPRSADLSPCWLDDVSPIRLAVLRFRRSFRRPVSDGR